jgi:pyruvate formate lyase activating enzyme
MRRGERHLVSDIMDKVRRYEKVLKATGGGVTLSGGEPLLQAAFVENVFVECKKLGLHTALDTSGFLGARASNRLLANTDLVLLDVKSGLPDVYRKATGRPLQPTLDFGRRLDAQGKAIWVRFVLVPGLTDGEENITAVADYVASLSTVERVEVLPFHQMGRDKWHELNEIYELEDTPVPTNEAVAKVREEFSRRGLTVF